jgi:hypothetical protein
MELFVLLSIVCGLLINIGPVTPSELRFCYKGWQRLKKDDCPYGLVFKYPVDLECYFSFGPDSPKLDKQYYKSFIVAFHKDEIVKLKSAYIYEFTEFTTMSVPNRLQ